jgi:hypothetical protein
MLGFLLGAIAGGVVGYYWRENIRDYVSNRVPDLRNRAAEGLGTLGERASSALDRARSRIDTSVRTGQERLRATGKAGGGGPVHGSGFGAGSHPSREAGPSSTGGHR